MRAKSRAETLGLLQQPYYSCSRDFSPRMVKGSRWRRCMWDSSSRRVRLGVLEYEHASATSPQSTGGLNFYRDYFFSPLIPSMYPQTLSEAWMMSGFAVPGVNDG